MADNSIAQEQSKQLKQKLDSSINANKALERELEEQSTLLLPFITKLSLTCRGLDKELDNRLAELRLLVTKKPSTEKLTNLIDKTTKSLVKVANKNEVSLTKTHESVINAAKALQALSGLPNQLRRDLREVIDNLATPLESLPSYVPDLLVMLDLYNGALKVNNQTSSVSTADKNRQFNAYQQSVSATTSQPDSSDSSANKLTKMGSAESNNVNPEMLDKFAKILSHIAVSSKQESKLSKIRQQIQVNVTSEIFINTVIDTFELVINDLNDERAIAESFLFNLNDALSSVEKAVKNTLASTYDDESEQNQLNNKLKQQITEMSEVVGTATSLEQLQTNINSKLSFIVGSLDEKAELDHKQKQKLQSELSGMVTRIEELEQQSANYQSELQSQKHKNMLDSLTKLPNRAAFDEHLSNSIELWQRSPFDLAVVVLDLDHFKRINDTYGHSAGDKTLQVIAKTLNKFANANTFVGRFGGEEFVIIMSQCNKKAALEKMELLRTAIEKLPFKFKQQKVTITISIGITHIVNGDNMHLAFERADEALYAAKDQGRNRIVYQ